MAHPEKVRARIQFVDQTLARLRAERGRLVARATVAARKRDTCRKILVGSAVLAAVAHEGVPSRSTPEALMAWLEPRLTRPHDRAAFDLEP
jgi:hypothetical protein